MRQVATWLPSPRSAHNLRLQCTSNVAVRSISNELLVRTDELRNDILLPTACKSVGLLTIMKSNPFAPLAQGIAKCLQCRVIPNWRMERLALAEHVRELFRVYDIRTVLDVGANLGQFRDFLRREVNFAGLIHSFEPIGSLVERMENRKQGDSNWVIHACALGSKADSAEIQVMSSGTFSSLRNVAADAPVQFRSSTEVVRRETVRVERLDDEASRIGLVAQNTYLKVDTQGYDLEVIAGGVDTLGHIPAMQFELSLRRIYEGVPDYREVLTMMQERGFWPSGFFPISVDERLRAIELDCVLVRERD